MDAIIVTVEDGIVQSTFSLENGLIKDITSKIFTIDYDNLHQGDCPVCGDTVIDNNQNYFCPECGYSTETENAVECAVKYWSSCKLVTYGNLISI